MILSRWWVTSVFLVSISLPPEIAKKMPFYDWPYIITNWLSDLWSNVPQQYRTRSTRLTPQEIIPMHQVSGELQLWVRNTNARDRAHATGRKHPPVCAVCPHVWVPGQAAVPPDRAHVWGRGDEVLCVWGRVHGGHWYTAARAQSRSQCQEVSGLWC